MRKNNVVKLTARDTISDPLAELLRTGAERLIYQAVEVELLELLAEHSERWTEDGKAGVVRNGHLSGRDKRLFDLVKDFGTSQSSKIDSIFESLLCPDRPAYVTIPYCTSTASCSCTNSIMTTAMTLRRLGCALCMLFISPFRSPFRPYNRAYAYRGLTAFHGGQRMMGKLSGGNGKRTPEQEEIKRLKIKMKRLEMEKEILKKSVIIQLKNWKKCLTRFFCIFSDFKEDCLPT
ncbi:MAG: hypothetical protein KZQ60_00610, partial [Candidatus Thiodiazotropha sp. (ex Lucinoma aequizonata)]|nr:hypothetical protein [Candidatus Thiodiazotropha sp. (ex Lucinoma aequizonata)]MCU7888313.1 hypothetical protein [Candidatus Thiodiazotropha sp. (ex Lucinoma aequizonata)]MCU7899827.1 hypothetical protein [Candidatus Thiodiazotropha sp. (ex Lucinoma aequizonata)]MCU7908625.1 hypothetical protein [Candidatus Thiodiazotropha sp. (ex Lucinoma aequizonata)]MCU7912054.1 hypothetical protein [Candidatus Thiodiazotropha sp. (ex Lucinoma aequizonata)]